MKEIKAGECPACGQRVFVPESSKVEIDRAIDEHLEKYIDCEWLLMSVHLLSAESHQRILRISRREASAPLNIPDIERKP